MPCVKCLQPFDVRDRHLLEQRRADIVRRLPNLLGVRHTGCPMPLRLNIGRERMCLQRGILRQWYCVRRVHGWLLLPQRGAKEIGVRSWEILSHRIH